MTEDHSPINLGLFPPEDKRRIARLAASLGLSLVIDDAPLDIHDQPVLYSIRLTAHCPATELWPFWEAYRRRTP